MIVETGKFLSICCAALSGLAFMLTQDPPLIGAAIMAFSGYLFFKESRDA